MWMLVLALGGCDQGFDYVEETDVDEPDTEDHSCDELEIEWDGPDEPHVGDDWTVLLYCDDALVLGGLILRIEPPDMALVDENVVTWDKVGEATLSVQRGQETVEQAVTIAP